MTIKPGEPWGRTVERPADLVVVVGDVALAAHLAALRDGSASTPVFAAGGDLARTLGDPPIEDRRTLNALPVDLIDVRFDDAAGTACAHVVVANPWWRGGKWRGSVVAVMNAEYIGDWDVAPRGHPNDGRVEVFEIDASFGLRQRWQALRRVRSASHVPHAGITTRSVRHASWTFDTPMIVQIDGRRCGRALAISVTVVSDAAVVHA